MERVDQHIGPPTLGMLRQQIDDDHRLARLPCCHQACHQLFPPSAFRWWFPHLLSSHSTSTTQRNVQIPLCALSKKVFRKVPVTSAKCPKRSTAITPPQLARFEGISRPHGRVCCLRLSFTTIERRSVGRNCSKSVDAHSTFTTSRTLPFLGATAQVTRCALVRTAHRETTQHPRNEAFRSCVSMQMLTCVRSLVDRELYLKSTVDFRSQSITRLPSCFRWAVLYDFGKPKQFDPHTLDTRLHTLNRDDASTSRMKCWTALTRNFGSLSDEVLIVCSFNHPQRGTSVREPTHELPDHSN